MVKAGDCSGGEKDGGNTEAACACLQVAGVSLHPLAWGCWSRPRRIGTACGLRRLLLKRCTNSERNKEKSILAECPLLLAG